MWTDREAVSDLVIAATVPVAKCLPSPSNAHSREPISATAMDRSGIGWLQSGEQSHVDFQSDQF
jgi:hypothetical protein